jgi:hypothetical protein
MQDLFFDSEIKFRLEIYDLHYDLKHIEDFHFAGLETHDEYHPIEADIRHVDIFIVTYKTDLQSFINDIYSLCYQLLLLDEIKNHDVYCELYNEYEIISESPRYFEISEIENVIFTMINSLERGKLK